MAFKLNLVNIFNAFPKRSGTGNWLCNGMSKLTYLAHWGIIQVSEEKKMKKGSYFLKTVVAKVIGYYNWSCDGNYNICVEKVAFDISHHSQCCWRPLNEFLAGEQSSIVDKLWLLYIQMAGIKLFGISHLHHQFWSCVSTRYWWSE